MFTPDDLLRSAIIEVPDPQPTDFVSTPRRAFVDDARMGATNTSQQGSFDVGTLTTPARFAIATPRRTYQLADDAREIADLMLCLFVLEGWDSVLDLMNGIQRAQGKLTQQTETSTQELGRIQNLLTSDISGVPEGREEARRRQPAVEQQITDAKAQAKALNDLLFTAWRQADLFVERFGAALAGFEREAREDMLKTLATNAAAVQKELARYGVVRGPHPLYKITIRNNEHTHELRTALAEVVECRERLFEAQNAVLAAQIAAPVFGVAQALQFFSAPGGGVGGALHRTARNPVYATARENEAQSLAKLLDAQRTYAIKRAEWGAKHPIVFRIAETLKVGATASDVAEAVYHHARATLSNIEAVRANLSPTVARPTAPLIPHGGSPEDPARRVAERVKPVDVWRAPLVIQQTMARLKYEPGALEYAMVTRVLEHLAEPGGKANEKTREQMLTAVGFVLGFAGPTAVLITGVLSGLTAMRNLAKHRAGVMLFDTALDPAQALTDKEPEAFNILVALVAAGMDIVPAAGAVGDLLRPVLRQKQVSVLKGAVPAEGAAAIVISREERIAMAALAEALAAVGKKVDPAGTGVVPRAISARLAIPRRPPTVSSAAALPQRVRRAREAADAVRKKLPNEAAKIDRYLDADDWEALTTRLASYENPGTFEQYLGKLRTIQGDIFERAIPRLERFQKALNEAQQRLEAFGGTWGKVQVARFVRSASVDDIRLTSFSDMVMFAEGSGPDTAGFQLLLTFIEAKSGKAGNIRRQFRDIEHRARTGLLELNGRQFSFENLVYLLPRTSLDPSSRVTRYVAVFPTPLTTGRGLANRPELIMRRQDLTAEVWQGPFTTQTLQTIAETLAEFAGIVKP